MSGADDWGDLVGDRLFDRPRARMLCSESRVVRLLCLVIALPWFLVTLPTVLVALTAQLAYTAALIPYKGLMKIWAGPVCEEDEDAGS